MYYDYDDYNRRARNISWLWWLQQERENVAAAILESLNAACGSWGITCIRYQVILDYHDEYDDYNYDDYYAYIMIVQIRDMRLPIRVQEAMQMEVSSHILSH